MTVWLVLFSLDTLIGGVLLGREMAVATLERKHDCLPHGPSTCRQQPIEERPLW